MVTGRSLRRWLTVTAAVGGSLTACGAPAKAPGAPITGWDATALPGHARDAWGVGCRGARCVIAGDNASTASVVWTTSDAGGSWRQRTLPGATNGIPPGLVPSEAGASDVAAACSPPQTCVVSGSSTAASAAVWLSANGGATWTEHDLPGGNGSAMHLSCLAHTASCVAAGTDDSYDTVVWVTRDGGLTWQRSAVPEAYDAEGPVACSGPEPSSATCLLAALPGSTEAKTVGIWRSTDGGITWQPGVSLTGGFQSIGAIVCPTSRRCVMASTSGPRASAALWSGDGGRTWSRQTLPGSGGAAAPVVDCLTTTHCVFVGVDKAGWLASWETADGGRHWKRTHLPQSHSPQGPSAISCAASSGRCMVTAKDSKGYPTVWEST